MQRHYEVLIAGAGPAGLAAGLHLLHQRPALKGRIAAIDKARHPRFKVCAGGLIPKAISLLEALGLKLNVPSVEVFRGQAVTEAGTIAIPARAGPLCTIIRRDQFDAMLARAAQCAGLALIENTRVLTVRQAPGRVEVDTSAGTLTANVLIGADGSGSRIRSALFGPSKASLGRALMFDVPLAPTGSPPSRAELYRFDFRCVAAGVPGYSWAFPCLIDGVPHLNAGIYEWHAGRASPGPDRKPRLLEELGQAFPDIPFDTAAAGGYKAFPIRWYNPNDCYVANRVILAGDAAGVDPLMGEGISFALEHGQMAADATAHFLDGDAHALQAYDRALHAGYNGRKLGRLAFAARCFYGPRHRLYFKLAALSRHAQVLGLDWYNGANRVDQTSALRVTARCLTSILLRRDPAH